jgi:hypothetical protein
MESAIKSVEGNGLLYVVPVQVDEGWQEPETPPAVHLPYVQHWMLAGPGQSPGVLVPSHDEVDIHSPGWPLAVQSCAATRRAASAKMTAPIGELRGHILS